MEKARKLSEGGVRKRAKMRLIGRACRAENTHRAEGFMLARVGGRTGGGEACEAANHDHDADSLRSPSGCIILGFDINCLRNLTICLHRSAA